jgi:hypothetical protein
LLAVALAIYECVCHTAQGVAAPGPFSPYFLVYSGSRIFIAVVAATLLLKPRLSADESRLFGGLIGLSLDLLYNFYPDPWPLWLTAAIANAGLGFGIAQLIRYAAGHLPSGPFARAAAAFGVFAGAAIALAGFLPVYLYFVAGMDEGPFGHIAPTLGKLRWLSLLIAVVGLEAIAIAALRFANESRRARLLVATAGFAPLVVTTAVHACVYLVRGHDVDLAQDVDALGNALTALALAYGAGSRRLVDVQYALNAAATATVTAAILTVIAFLGEHFIAPLIEAYIVEMEIFKGFGEQVRGGVELGVAFCTFLGIDRLHEWSAEFTRDLIFRHRAEHIAALREFAEGISEAAPGEIARQLVGVAVENAGAGGAALYVRKGSHFKLAVAQGEADRSIAFNDARVPELRRVRTGRDGSLALPMPIGKTLSGFLYCRNKRSGEDYAPDETALLALAARETGIVLRPAS